MVSRRLAISAVAMAFWLVVGGGGVPPDVAAAGGESGVEVVDSGVKDLGEGGGPFRWEPFPDLPDELGFAGPIVGGHRDALIVAGGANFPRPRWESEKRWHDRIFVLRRSGEALSWADGGRLRRPLAYAASVSTPDGVLCMGGNDGRQTLDEVFALRWDPIAETVERVDYPPLPRRCAYGQATLVGSVVYLAGGQQGEGLDTAMANLWALDLSRRGDGDAFRWVELPDCPGGVRSFSLTVSQHNGYDDCVYVISGRRESGREVELLQDVWEYNPRGGAWRRRGDAPRCLMAGTAIGVGQSHVAVLGGDDGRRFGQADSLREEHPGFVREALLYHTITDRWVPAGEMPLNQVTTVPVKWDGEIVIASGEIRPRVRTNRVWRVSIARDRQDFGALNYIVLVGYLAGIVGIGVWFAGRNRNTDDYFRGGKHLPWWAAGCSIFATMLSSLTFTGIPSKAFAQDWVYAIGNLMIPVVAVVAVYVALPFYRGLDVTSAYEYLERRFDRSIRLFASASFALFHLFRMAVVMSLTGLALAVATPLSPCQSIGIMGVLSIVYCTLGGVSAVIWTDTLQTFVLMGGAILALGTLIAGADGGLGGAAAMAWEADKLRLANFHWDATAGQLALWVVVFGAIGQNVSSYTADQAVVQRYMTTADTRLAARSIWTNALLTIPSTLLFFGIGTALFAFYRSHPEKLDPGITTDQVFPLFIATEMPAGVAGVMVAAIFAAAQSTVSTSMNSTATTLVTDWMRPLGIFAGERRALPAARLLTLWIGLAGTWLAVVFANPDIRSLFDAFIQVIGLFMGVLGGLFLLGVMTTRANAFGARCGALVGAGTMVGLWRFTDLHGYLYTTCGIVACLAVGFLASLTRDRPRRDLSGLTLFSRGPSSATASAIPAD